jgi:methionine-rich copper-binding protein CopC
MKTPICFLTLSLCLGTLAAPLSAAIRAPLTVSTLPGTAFDPTGSLLLGMPVADPFRLSAGTSRPLIRLAHAILVKAAPDKEATISDSPEEVLLIFNEGVGQEYLALAVVDSAGKRVDRHDAKLDFTDRSHLRASIDKLNPGRYMVRYRVLSADGHVVSGKYFFQMQDPKGESDHAPPQKP